MSSKKGYDDLIKLIRQFLWVKWDDNRGSITTSWTHCIQPKSKGGLGLIDPRTQGFCVATKWIIRVVHGDESWNILIWNHINLASVKGKWQHVGWFDKNLHASFFSIKASSPLSLYGRLGNIIVIF